MQMIKKDIPFSLRQGYGLFSSIWNLTQIVHFFPEGAQRGQETKLKEENNKVKTPLLLD